MRPHEVELLYFAQKEILELLTAGAPLRKTLQPLVLAIETLMKGSLVSILLVDSTGKRLITGAAPHLPDSFNNAIDGAEIGPNAGSCGTSAFRKKLVVVKDTHTDPLWQNYKQLTIPLGLHACWSSPILSRSGNVLGTFATYFHEAREPTPYEIQLINDVTAIAALSIEHVQYRESLKESEERFKQLSEAAFEAICIHRKGNILIANENFVKAFGYDLEELKGKNLKDLCAPGWWDLAWKQIQSKAEGPYEILLIRKDGSEFWGEIRAKSLIYQGDVARISITRDISAQKLAQEKVDHLLATEKLLRENATFLANASQVLASSLDYEQTLKMVAELTTEYLADWCFLALINNEERLQVVTSAVKGSQDKQIRELRSFQLDPNAPEGLPRAIRSKHPLIYSDIQDSQLNPGPGEWPIIGSRDPNYLHAIRQLGLKSYMAVPIYIREKTVGAIFIASSSSSHRYTQSDLELANELARSCATAIDNARHYRDAQRSIQIRDDFISIASHELRTPLTSLTIQNQLIQKHMDTPHDQPHAHNGFLKSLLLDSESQIDRLSKLVENFLDVSRISEGKLAYSFESEVDLRSLVGEIIRRYSPQIEAAHCKILLSAPKKISGTWDRFRIEKVIIHLLTNALKYGRGKPIEISLSESGPNAVLTLTDHGIGIAREDQEKIFGRFERVASLKAFGGFGLGLYIARKIIEGHDGSIKVKSEPGQGSTFEVTLPLHATQAARETA